MSVDQAQTIYVQDALEIFDKTDATFLNHELITSHLLKYNQDKKKVLKTVGSFVVPRKHIAKIMLDKKFQRLYDEHTEPRMPDQEFAQEPAKEETKS